MLHHQLVGFYHGVNPFNSLKSGEKCRFYYSMLFLPGPIFKETLTIEGKTRSSLR
jgi:hypothetical protein